MPAHNSTSRKIAVVYHQLPESMAVHQQDILDYVDEISSPLIEAGYEPVPVPVTLDLSDMLARISTIEPLLVFNLVEAIHDLDCLLHLVPSVLEAFRIPFTGVGARGNFLTTDKLLAKDIMRLAGLPTPPWQRCDALSLSGPTALPLPAIVKPVATDASRDIDERSYCRTQSDLAAKVASLAPALRHNFFAEHFVHGREFNVSMMATSDGVRVLPAAEMTFVDYPPDKPTIVDFKAKWVVESFEYAHTVRRFDFEESDLPLVDEIRRLSLRAWEVFGLQGYARVDMRIDTQGHPWILELNANPCITADAGFIAAGERAGLSYAQMIVAIVEDAVRRDAVRQ